MGGETEGKKKGGGGQGGKAAAPSKVTIWWWSLSLMYKLSEVQLARLTSGLHLMVNPIQFAIMNHDSGDCGPVSLWVLETQVQVGWDT